VNSPKIISRLLKGEHEVRMAQKLVYQVFVEEMDWIPTKDNPSLIRFIEDNDGSKLFVDDFDDVAMWFGSFYNQKLIACWRFCEQKNGKFELERYHAIPEFIRTSKNLEVTRLVVHPEYRKRLRVLLDLSQTAHKYLGQRFDHTFAAVQFPYPGNVYLKLGLKKANSKPFKYSYLDKNEVELIFMDFKDKRTLASGYRGLSHKCTENENVYKAEIISLQR